MLLYLHLICSKGLVYQTYRYINLKGCILIGAFYLVLLYFLAILLGSSWYLIFHAIKALHHIRYWALFALCKRQEGKTETERLLLAIGLDILFDQHLQVTKVSKGLYLLVISFDLSRKVHFSVSLALVSAISDYLVCYCPNGLCYIRRICYISIAS